MIRFLLVSYFFNASLTKFLVLSPSPHVPCKPCGFYWAILCRAVIFRYADVMSWQNGLYFFLSLASCFHYSSCLWNSSMLLHILVDWSFSRLHFMTFDKDNTIYLSILLWLGIWVISSFGLFQTGWLWTFVSVCFSIFSWAGVGVLTLRVGAHSALLEISQQSSELVIPIYPPSRS